ncbi:HDOD domain-containing protein [Pseudoalteromonas ardens]|uniref:Histidine kinase n=1 Tax=Pseudoalteromonas rubra TaxID=43658 RepID=A0A0L0EMI4_9GAMM|nr:HDOD domain-containing protein [Pseudoalteromonas sp. R96]KNC65560.1 histidine kinase [Pseudoalteromonas rubra]MDK1310902.1 HDOD domain-containing protein [Pseudoalteromonas sp. R96]
MAISLTQQEKLILKTVNIPPRPQALLQFSEEAKLPEPNITKISDILQSDVAISAAILQVVNSAAFRRSREIDSIEQAVMILGLKRLIPLVKAVALKSSVDLPAALSDFWETQSDIGQHASVICNRLNRPALANHAYMLGLFHGVGIPILCQHFDDYQNVLDKAQTDGWTEASQFEFARYHTSHGTIGALLAQQWRLPKIVINVIYYQHDVDGILTSGELDNIGNDLLSILKIARHKSYLATTPVSEQNPEWQVIKDDVMDYLDISDEELDELWGESSE